MWIVRSLSSRWCKGGTEISLSRTRVCWLLYYQFDSNMWTGPSSLSDDNAVVLPSTCRASLQLTVTAACWYQWRLTESLCLHSPSSSLSLSCYLCQRNAPFHSSDADVWPEKVDLGIGDENLANFVNNLIVRRQRRLYPILYRILYIVSNINKARAENASKLVEEC